MFAIPLVLLAILIHVDWLANTQVDHLVARMAACVRGAIAAVGNGSRSLFRRTRGRGWPLLGRRQVCSNAAFFSLHDWFDVCDTFLSVVGMPSGAIHLLRMYFAIVRRFLDQFGHVAIRSRIQDFCFCIVGFTRFESSNFVQAAKVISESDH